MAVIARLPLAQAHGVNTLQSALFAEGFQTYAGKTKGIILRNSQNKQKEVSLIMFKEFPPFTALTDFD